jgi:ABC-type Mn2+/Zn2+ transport system ATPase subunit
MTDWFLHPSPHPSAPPSQVLREVKLEKCADTIVGGTDPIYMKKGISGGERKRLSIAAELLLAPQLIFLDEPSSGACFGFLVVFFCVVLCCDCRSRCVWCKLG